MDDYSYRLRLKAARNQVEHRLSEINRGFVDLDLAVIHYKRLAKEAEEAFGRAARSAAFDDGG